MFELSKIVGWLVSPLPFALAIWGGALVLVCRGARRTSLGVGLVGILGLFVVSTPWVAHILVHRLESRFPALTVDQLPEADGIVLLGGALSGAIPPERPYFDFGSAADRVWYAAALYSAGKAPWVLVCGGNQPTDPRMQVEAEAVQIMLLTLGVPATAIHLEKFSRNTIENARQSMELIHSLGARRVLLVTSALHMPRALKIFQAEWQGADITIFPASTDVEGLTDILHPLGRWLPDANALALSTRALKEYLGLAAVIFMEH